ncbi:pyrroline-5-carboxylate reductase [Citricoccus sp.]|uniref:pyrroline-5-carboxylate reductase n=1 Tax=Citricoccus sp. TaxID=1978372 RepID=UPI0026325809|nr:pyrroline-5-carboxylate reductase [Citricoccus sp.]HRO29338.1 pyrroline-5-carboxylate reductase [Citricoccus sp.]HRO92629.1 pyrroline-5-carboxylate reductase [Citricoccus sp.]
MLGLGNMNGAILAGMLAAGTDPAGVCATVHSEDSARAAEERHGIAVSCTERDPEANRNAASGADVVVLGVKPRYIRTLCREISTALAPETVVVSVAAGITTAAMEESLPEGQPVVRTMPNTPLTVGMGAVGLAGGRTATEEHLEMAERLFAGSGSVHRVAEDQIDAVAAVSGSGPAYAFLLAELMAAGGAELGLDEPLAKELARSTVAGAGRMLADPDVDPAVLRRAVTSPNGTTEAAVESFLDAGLARLIADGMRASAERGRQISQEN